MALSRDEVKQLLVSLLPPGSEQLYALRNTDKIGGVFYALAQTLKQYGTDRVDQLRLEVNPSTMTEKIVDWEEACGLTNTPLARFGTTEQRRNAVLAVLREHSSFCLDDLRAAVQPYLNYQDPSQIQILETDRVALQALHTYQNLTPLAIGSNSTEGSTIRVLDDPRVSPAGAMVHISFTGNLSEVQFILTSPSGAPYVKFWLAEELGTGAVTDAIRVLYAREMAGAPIYGDWTLYVRTGAAAATLNAWSIFVEGLGVNYDNSMPPNRIGEGLGAAMFDFAVVADPALVGTGYNREGAYGAILKFKPAHTYGNIVEMNAVADLCAIPDEPETIPDRSIPC